MPNDSVCLHLLQHIRDESHRFAINYHRKLLRKTFKVSVLDDIRYRQKRKNTSENFKLLMVFATQIWINSCFENRLKERFAKSNFKKITPLAGIEV